MRPFPSAVAKSRNAENYFRHPAQIQKLTFDSRPSEKSLNLKRGTFACSTSRCFSSVCILWKNTNLRRLKLWKFFNLQNSKTIACFNFWKLPRLKRPKLLERRQTWQLFRTVNTSCATGQRRIEFRCAPNRRSLKIFQTPPVARFFTFSRTLARVSVFKTRRLTSLIRPTPADSDSTQMLLAYADPYHTNNQRQTIWNCIIRQRPISTVKVVCVSHG